MPLLLGAREEGIGGDQRKAGAHHRRRAEAHVFLVRQVEGGVAVELEGREQQAPPTLHFGGVQHQEGCLRIAVEGTLERHRRRGPAALAEGQLQPQGPIPGGHGNRIEALGGVLEQHRRQHGGEIVCSNISSIRSTRSAPRGRLVQRIGIERGAHTAAGNATEGKQVVGEGGHFRAQKGQSLAE